MPLPFPLSARVTEATVANLTLTEAFMADLYTCTCGNQTWQIFDIGVRCTKCNTEYPVQHMPVKEFNHSLTEELEEALEE